MKELKICGPKRMFPGGELWVQLKGFFPVVQQGWETGGSGLLRMGEEISVEF